MKFSIIVVSLNAGEELQKTINSVLSQSCQDFEIVVKDGGSQDGSIQKLPPSEKIHLYVRKDRSIYDAMNQAVEYAGGEYFLFLNCGDYLMDEKVLESVKQALEEEQEPIGILYGNQYERHLQSVIYANPQLTPFACYRNIPCHQTCFYHRSLFASRAYDLQYPVRADYEHFLWCYFEKKTRLKYVDTIICSYEGAGFSETKEHLKAAKKEHTKITATYVSVEQRALFRGILILTLQPLRTAIANSTMFSGIYNRLKTAIYRWKHTS